jgi:hypothetical protein
VKRIATLIVVLALLGGLVGLYAYLSQREVEDEATETPSKTVSLIKREDWEVAKAKFGSENGELTILPVLTPNPTPNPTAAPAEGSTPTPTPEVTNTPTPTPKPLVGWEVEGFEGEPLMSSVLSDMMRSVFSLDASEKVADTISDPKEYKLDPPEAYGEVEFIDGTKKRISIGMMSSARDYYYMSIEGDPALYLTYASTGEDFFKGVNDLIDKSVATVSAEGIQRIYIAQKGKTPIEFAYKGTDEQMQSDLEAYGSVSLNMVSPYDGWELYSTNFQTNVLDSLSGITMEEVIEAKPSNLSEYGLDDPELEIWMKDTSVDMHLLIGKDIDSDLAYAKFYDRPYVFSIKKSYLAKLKDMNVFQFTQRFVSLVNIDDCIGLKITGPNRSHEIKITHQTITPTPAPTPTQAPDDPEATPTPTPAESPTPTPTPVPQKVVNASVDGQSVQEAAFKDFYQSVIGLSYDSEIEEFTPSGSPEATISYQLQGKDGIEINLYPYNQNFYAIEKDGAEIRFVLNKQYVDLMFKTLDDLIAGNLDE